MEAPKRRDLPPSWTRSGNETFCLACRRALAAELALDAAPEDLSREDRAKLRRAALLEFEIRRDPGRHNAEIAKVCRSSVPAVAGTRRRLEIAEPPRSRR
jgi:hypothetical protein